MYIGNNFFKPENKTDNSDFTVFGMKIGPDQIYKNYPLSLQPLLE